jgi:gelsolin
VPVGCKSLNQGDCFVLDAGKEIYIWFGEECSPFEKRKASEIAHNIVLNRYGHAHLVEDVDDEHEEFWTAMGGKGDIASASDYQEPAGPPEQTAPKMYIVSDDVDARIHITEVTNVSKESLDSDNVNLIDVGSHVYIWVGKGASHREQSQSMVIVNTHLKNFSREKHTQVVRLLEGQESRCKGFKAVMSQ